jgi:tetratricopeptide (TPR) repeat protein
MRVALIAFALTIATAAPARADDAYAEAKLRMQEGKTLAERGKYDEARMKYQQACALMHTFSCVRSLGAMESKSGHYIEAYGHLSEALRDPLAAKLPDAVRHDLDEMRQAAFDATGHIEVDAPPGATVWLDDSSAGTAPLADPLLVTPGQHVVEVRGSAPQRKTVDVQAKVTTHVDLRPQVTAPLPSVESPGKTNVQPVPAPVEAPHTDEAPVPSAHAEFWGPTRTVGVIIAGVGVASLVAGGVFASQAQSDASRITSLQATLGGATNACAGSSAPAACNDLQSAKDAQSRDHTLNIAFVATGAVLVAAGGAVFFFWPRHDTAVAFTPAIGPHEAILGLGGQF